MISWLKKLLSPSNEASSSRFLQIVIVFSVIPLLWVVAWKGGWVISDNARLILLSLIGGGAGGYIVSKLKGGANAE